MNAANRLGQFGGDYGWAPPLQITFLHLWQVELVSTVVTHWTTSQCTKLAPVCQSKPASTVKNRPEMLKTVLLQVTVENYIIAKICEI